jgi:hypothetical protein
MTAVEQIWPDFRWADEIKVEHNGDQVALYGISRLAAQKNRLHRDLIAEHLSAISGNQSGDEQKAPHYFFANAHLESDRLAFVRRFGPICGDPNTLRLTSCLDDTGSFQLDIQLIQNGETLRKEQLTFASIFALYSQIHSETPDPENLLRLAKTIELGCAGWIKQFEEQESAVKQIDKNLGVPVWSPWEEQPWRWDRNQQGRLAMWIGEIHNRVLTSPSNSDTGRLAITAKDLRRCVDAGHMLLCEILNAFPVHVTRLEGSVVELPINYQTLGIRHILYYLLRSDYLRKTRIFRCAWKECLKWFRAQSQESPCCCEEHALRFRQWKYYHQGKGKKKRATRYRKVEKPKLETKKRRK